MTDSTTDIGALTDAQLAELMQPDPAPPPEPESPELAAALAPEPEAPAEEPKAEAKHVPLAELLEERGRRKEAQARMDEMERRFQEYQARTQQVIAERLAQQPQPEQAPVDYNEDPIEYLRRQQETVAQNLQQLHQQQQAFVQQQQADRQWTAMRTAVTQAESAFAQKTPDYYDAVNHLKTTRRAQLEAQGVPAQHIDQVLTQDAIAVASEAGRLGLSPAEYAYRIAMGSGYQPKAQRPAQAPQEAPKSLGGASGRAEPTTPSLKDVSKMSDADFNKLFDKLMTGT